MSKSGSVLIECVICCNMIGVTSFYLKNESNFSVKKTIDENKVIWVKTKIIRKN